MQHCRPSTACGFTFNTLIRASLWVEHAGLWFTLSWISELGISLCYFTKLSKTVRWDRYNGIISTSKMKTFPQRPSLLGDFRLRVSVFCVSVAFLLYPLALLSPLTLLSISPLCTLLWAHTYPSWFSGDTEEQPWHAPLVHVKYSLGDHTKRC